MEGSLNFAAGFIAGTTVTLIFVWLLDRIGAARKRAGERHSGKIGDRSASQVHRDSIMASFVWLFWILVLVVFLAALGYGAYLVFTR